MCVYAQSFPLWPQVFDLGHCINVCCSACCSACLAAEPRHGCRDWTSLPKGIILLINLINQINLPVCPLALCRFTMLSQVVVSWIIKTGKTVETNAIKALDLSRQWLCSLHCSGWPIWEWWRLLLFWGLYQSHAGQSTPCTQTNVQCPRGAMKGGRCAITETTWERTGEGWRQGYLGSVFISLMSHSLQSDRQANWKLLSHKILHGSILSHSPTPPPRVKKKQKKSAEAQKGIRSLAQKKKQKSIE